MASQLKRTKSDEPKSYNLTPSQRLAVASLAAGKTVTAAAEAAGVSRTTLYEWKDLPSFKAELNRSLAEQRDVIRGELLALATSAVRAIREMVESPETPPVIRLRACLAVLSAASGETYAIGSIDPADFVPFGSIKRQHEPGPRWNDLTQDP